MTPFGALLRFIREERGINQRDLAKIIEIDSRALSAIETGRRAPPSDDLIGIIARSMHLSSEELSALREAAQDSRYLVKLPKTSSPRNLKLVHRIIRSLDQLNHAQFNAIQQVLDGGQDEMK